MTRTASVELRASGVTVVRIDPQAIQTKDDARDNIAAAVEAGRPWRRPVMVDIRGCNPLEADVRHCYAGDILENSFVALCMLLDISPLGQTMGNLYLRVAKPKIPTRLCYEEKAAFEWLVGFTSERLQL